MKREVGGSCLESVSWSRGHCLTCGLSHGFAVLTVLWQNTSDELGAEQLVQTSNIGFQFAITILSLKKVLNSPALMGHHIITVLGCFALLHRRHCAGYGAAFTAFTEFGSTFHNIMSLHGGQSTRYLRVFTNVITRGGIFLHAIRHDLCVLCSLMLHLLTL